MTAPMVYRAHGKALMVLGLPLIGSHLAQFAIHMTDALMLGWHDVDELAAVTLAGTFHFVIFIVGSGFAFAVMPLVASAEEAGDGTRVRRVTRMGLWLSVIYGAVFSVPYVFADTILLSIGQAPLMAELGQDYLGIVWLTLIPALLVMALKSYLSALEHTAVILWLTVGTALLNVVINYALIFGNWGFPEMGIEGAAIASVAVVAITLAGLVLYVLWRVPQHALFTRFWRSDWEAFGEVFRLGWPIGLTSLAEGGLFSMSAVMMGWVGTLELAAHGAAVQLASLAFMVHIGLSQAATVRAGRALGRGDGPGLRRGGIVANAASQAFVLVTVAAFLLLPEPLIALFLDQEDPRLPQIIAVGVGLLMAAALFQVADAAQVVALGLLRGVRDTAQPMVTAVISYWVVGVPASYLLGFTFGFGGVGIWLGLVIGLALAGLLLNLRFWRRSAWIEGSAGERTGPDDSDVRP